jgi:hypothetical protein
LPCFRSATSIMLDLCCIIRSAACQPALSSPRSRRCPCSTAPPIWTPCSPAAPDCARSGYPKLLSISMS